MREIVQDALKCEELVHQFFYIDREDVESDISDEIINKFYPDKYLIKEAKHRLDIANENLDFFAPEDEDYKSYAKGHKQLTKFIGKLIQYTPKLRGIYSPFFLQTFLLTIK